MKANIEGKNVIPFEEAVMGKKMDEEISIFEEVFNEIGEVMPEFGGVELAALFALPDDKFSVLSVYFLDELDKALNNADDKIALAQSLNISGTKLEDLTEFFEKLTKEIDEQLSGKISQVKLDFMKQMFSILINAVQDSEGVAKRIIQIPIELCHEEAKVPSYARAGDAGMDIYALEDVDILPGETKIIPTGIKVAIPRGYAILIQPRSGQSAKSKLRIANTPGLIDSGYRDEIGVIVENIEPAFKDINYDFNDNGKIIINSILHGSPIHIEKGQRFAQMRLVEAPSISFFKVEDVHAYEGDRLSGFGGTGNK